MDRVKPNENKRQKRTAKKPNVENPDYENVTLSNVNEDNKQPSVHERTTPPSVHERTKPPSVHERTKPPSAQAQGSSNNNHNGNTSESAAPLAVIPGDGYSFYESLGPRNDTNKKTCYCQPFISQHRLLIVGLIAVFILSVVTSAIISYVVTVSMLGKSLCPCWVSHCVHDG
jgi:hypothetical protein